MAAVDGPSDAFYRSVLASLPPVEFAVAYGSGVIAQEDAPHPSAAAEIAAVRPMPRARQSKMVDFLLAVSDARAWHAANLRTNGAHYSALGWLGARAVVSVQCSRFGAGVYFNTLVPHAAAPPGGVGTEVRLIKYGVISTERLRADLLGWEALYVSGRLHKPVRTLVECADLRPALDANLRAAVAAALLLLPARFSERELHCALAALSYAGDVRMGLAEDPRKVERIVAGAQGAFRTLYAEPLASAAPDVLQRGPTGEWAQRIDAATTASRLRGLPARVRAHVVAAVATRAADFAPARTERGAAAAPPSVDAVAALAPREAVQGALRAHLASTVRRASATQSLKGVLTAGAVKSAVYVARKLAKGRLS